MASTKPENSDEPDPIDYWGCDNLILFDQLEFIFMVVAYILRSIDA